VDGEKCRAHWNDDKEEGAGIKVRIIVYRAKYYQFIVVFLARCIVGASAIKPYSLMILLCFIPDWKEKQRHLSQVTILCLLCRPTCIVETCQWV